MRIRLGEGEQPQAEVILADLPLARRLEVAWDLVSVENARAQARLDPQSGAEVLAVGGGHAVFLGPGSPLSQAQGAGMDGPVSDEELDRLERFFRDRGTPTRIEVASLADPAFLPTLSQRRYTIQEQTHTLAALVARPAKRTDDALPDAAGVEVVLVDPGGLDDWVDVILSCFFEKPLEPPPQLRDGARAMTTVPGLTAWLARVDGQPAGGGSLLIHDGLALLCGDGTLAGFRQRGVQTALLQARLAHAAALGCDLATICTLPASGSQRNAERQGFRIIYARTTMVLA